MVTSFRRNKREIRKVYMMRMLVPDFHIYRRRALTLVSTYERDVSPSQIFYHARYKQQRPPTPPPLLLHMIISRVERRTDDIWKSVCVQMVSELAVWPTAASGRQFELPCYFAQVVAAALSGGDYYC